MLILRPESHRSEYHHGRAPDGYSAATGPTIEVEAEDEGLGVRLTLDPLPVETLDDRPVDRILTPEEARALAAVLWHVADEQERRWR